MKRRKNALTCSLVLVGLIAAVCLLGALGYLAYYRLLPPLIVGGRDAARPTVTIFAPQHGDQVATSATVVVQAEGTARGSQVVLIQLWADGTLVGEQNGSAERLNASWSWLPLIPGDHTLTVRAYNARRDAGVAMVRVTAIEAADADRDGVPDAADTCPDRAGLLQLDGCPPGMTGGTSSSNPEAQEVADAWVAPGGQEQPGSGPAGEQPGPRPGEGEGDTDGDGVADANDQCPDQPGPPENQGCPREVSGGEPGTIQGGQQRPEFDDSDFPVGQQVIERNCAICDWLEGQGREYGDVELSGAAVEVEMLSLRTAGGLSDVACYARLPNPQWEQWGRVPEGQNEFFAPLGDGSWNIADYLGGEHGVVVTVPEGESLRMDVRCFGRLPGNMLDQSLHLGEVVREHGPADWNGQTFTARGQEGANWFDIQYRICSVPCEEGVIPPPYDLYLAGQGVGGLTSYRLSWRWDGDISAIDGFEIYRDGNYIDFSANEFAFLSPSTVEPQGCSQEYRFEVRAVKGAQSSAPSNPAFSPASSSCRGRNELEVEDVTLPTPPRADLTVSLRYWYDGTHGDQVFVFVLPLQGGSPPGWPNLFHASFSITNAAVRPGGGDVPDVHVYYGGSQPLTTEGLRLVMMDANNELFYTRDVPLAVHWYPSGPDLAWSGIDIFSAPRQVDGQIQRDLQFVVVNRGYARLIWSPSLHVRLGNGQLAMPSDPLGDVVLPPGGNASFVWSVPEDIWLALAPTYQVTLDPDNTIAELDEGNNTFTGAVSRLRITYEEVAFFNGMGIWEENDQYFVGPGGQLLALMPGPSGPWLYGEMLQFKGAVRDDWEDNWTVNDLYRPHVEGIASRISTDPSAPLWEDLAFYFDIIRGGCYSHESYVCCAGRHRGEWEELCDHLISRGFAPERNWVEVPYLPSSPQRFWFYFYDVDVHYQWWPPDYVEEYETVCDFYQDIPAAQLQNLPGEFILGSAEQGCMVKVSVEEVLNP